MTMQVHVSKLF